MVESVGATLCRTALADGLEVMRQGVAVALTAGAIEALAQRDDRRPGLGLAGAAGQLVDQGIGLWTLDIQR